MRTVVAMSPFRCRMWALHDRLETTISEESCREEIASFNKHGQLIPVLGRPLKGDPTHEVELIYGARRLFIARHLGIDLQVEMREIGDRDAIIAMDIENRLRSDISPYERAISYASWLRGGLFQSQDDVARALKTSASQVSRLLKLARLPSVVVDAFSSPRDIREVWGLEISECLDDPERRKNVIRVARAIAAMNPRPCGAEVHRQLMTSSVSGRRRRAAERDHVITDSSGAPRFRIRRLRSAVALLMPAENISEAVLAAVTQQVLDVLQRFRPSERTLRVKVENGALGHAAHEL